MIDLKTLWEILATVGLSGLVAIIIAYAVQIILRVWANRANAQTRQFNVSTQQEEIVNTFAVDFNAERRVWEDRHHKLQEEFTTFRIEQAKKDGAFETLEKLLKQERDERRDELTASNNKYNKLEMRVEELEKNNQKGLDRITELEGERDTLNKQVKEKETTIRLLEETHREIAGRLEQESNRANSLSLLVERLQAIPMSTSDTTPIPALSVDDTIIPMLATNAADVAAEETKP